MAEVLPQPPHLCPACGGGHYAAVRFCPFCGAALARPEPAAPPYEPPTAPPDAPPAVVAIAPPPPPAGRAPSPVPPVSQVPPVQPTAAPPAAPPTDPRWIRPRRRFRVRARQAVLAALAIAGLAWMAAGRRETLPAPGRVVVGPAWTAVALAPYRAAPLLRLTADAPFSLRLDGDRVTRAGPGNGAVVRPGALRGLELRSGRGQITVTLTPRAQ